MCPPGIPDLGSACTTTGQQCRYGCGQDGARVCTDGVWFRADGGPCPISTRKLKQEITYVSPTERHRLYDETLAVRLATWEYTDPSIARGRKLGFIIEDSPGIPAIDRERQMVDLYGYASMLLATAQTQAEQIAALQKEVKQLRRAQRPSAARRR
jgi:hypothetical protein